MKAVLIQQETRCLAVRRYTAADLNIEEQDLNGLQPMEVVFTVGKQTSSIWFDDTTDFDFFTSALASYYDDFRKEVGNGR